MKTKMIKYIRRLFARKTFEAKLREAYENVECWYV